MGMARTADRNPGGPRFGSERFAVQIQLTRRVLMNVPTYVITVDPTNATDDLNTNNIHPLQDLEYSFPHPALKKLCQAYHLHVTSAGTESIAWQLPPTLATANPANVHLFILFPPGKSPFSNGDAFHTTLAAGATTPAGQVGAVNPPTDFKYCVMVIDENCKPRRVHSDDPIISNSGSGGGPGPMVAHLRATLASVMGMGDRSEAKKLQHLIQAAIDAAKKVQSEGG